MNAADIPIKIPTAFATSAGPLKAAIPQTPSGVSGRASWSLGFPSETMEPLAAGGVPPYGQDFNGVLYAMSLWLRWMNAGAPIGYDPTYSSEIGGYPMGGTVTSADNLGWWVSTVDANTTDPDTSGAGWLFVPINQSYAGDPNMHVAGHAGTTIGGLSSPPSTVWDSANLVLWYCSTTGNAAGAIWKPILSVNPVSAVVANSHNYVATDNGKVVIRSNAGSPMTDAFPTSGTVTNGWGVTIYNADPTASLTLTTTTSFNGVVDAGLILLPNQNVTVRIDAAGGVWSTVPPVPQVFSGQAVYVNASGSYPPGVYDIDTSAGPVNMQLELGGVTGDNYHFRDVTGSFAAHNFVIDPNGRTIEGQAGTFVCDVPWTDFVLSRNTNTDWSLV